MKKYSIVIIALLSTMVLAQIAWKSYTVPDYGITLSYPTNLPAHKTFTKSYLLNDAWSVNANSVNSAQQHSLYEIVLANKAGTSGELGQYYYHSYLRVGASTEPDDLNKCLSENLLFTHKKSIGNGAYEFTFSDASMSQYLSGRAYRYKKANICLSVEWIETGTKGNATLNQERNNVDNLAKQLINKLIMQ